MKDIYTHVPGNNSYNYDENKQTIFTFVQVSNN